MAQAAQQEFWRWPETSWVSPNIDWKKSELITAGVDVGSVSTQAVVMVDAELFAYGNTRTGSDSPNSAWNGMNFTLEKSEMKMDNIDYTIGTGYGRVNVPMAQQAITEITCHARGAKHLVPDAHTVIDIGGQDSKVIRLDDRGGVENFTMNDKCAAGTGRFLEVMASALEVEIGKLGELSAQSKQQVKVSSMCTVFAESEVISLLSKECSKADIAAAIHDAIARRIIGMVSQLGLREKVVMVGGVAKNSGVVRSLERMLGTTFLIPEEPQITGALGAALIAAERCQ